MSEFLILFLNTNFDTFIILVGLAFVANFLGNNKPKLILSLIMFSGLYFWSVFYENFSGVSNSIMASSIDCAIFIGIYLIQRQVFAPLARKEDEKSPISFRLIKIPLAFAILANWLAIALRMNDVTEYMPQINDVLTILYWLQVIILVGSNDLFVRFIFSRRCFNRRSDNSINRDTHLQIFPKAFLW